MALSGPTTQAPFNAEVERIHEQFCGSFAGCRITGMLRGAQEAESADIAAYLSSMTRFRISGGFSIRKSLNIGLHHDETWAIDWELRILSSSHPFIGVVVAASIIGERLADAVHLIVVTRLREGQ